MAERYKFKFRQRKNKRSRRDTRGRDDPRSMLAHIDALNATPLHLPSSELGGKRKWDAGPIEFRRLWCSGAEAGTMSSTVGGILWLHAEPANALLAPIGRAPFERESARDSHPPPPPLLPPYRTRPFRVPPFSRSIESRPSIIPFLYQSVLFEPAVSRRTTSGPFIQSL